MSKASSARWFISIVLFVGLVWRLIPHGHPAPHPLSEAMLAMTSDAVIDHLSVRQYDETGMMMNALETPHLHHIPKNNIHFINSPHLRVTQPNQSPWDIQSDEAKAIAGGKEVNFHQHVLIRQKKLTESFETILATEDLTYIPAQQKAMTSQKVLVTQGDNQIQSQGLIADLAKQRVLLLSDARGHYVPSKG